MYEIYAVKILFMFITESVEAASISISAFLAGLAFSSLFFSGTKIRKLDQHSVLIFMQAAVAIYALLVLRNFEFIPSSIDYISDHFPVKFVYAFKFILFWIFLFIPAFFIGGSFPIINDLYIKVNNQGTSTIYFWDTLGAVAGSLVAGFILIPHYGLTITIIVPVMINLITIISLTKKIIIKLLIFAYILVIPIYLKHENISAPRISNTEVALEKLNVLDFKLGNIIFRKQSPFGVITVGDGALGIMGNRGLFVNYRDMCHSLVNKSEKLMGKLTAEYLPINSKVLNIGLGCGFTASEIEGNKNVKHLDIAEINPVIVEASKKYFVEDNNNVLNSPKVRVIVQDGAEYIRQTKDKYNAVIIDIEEVSIIYSSPLYTQEYFSIIKKKLKASGILALWSFYVSPEFSRVIYNTLKSVFSNVYMRVREGNITFYASTQSFNSLGEDIEGIEYINRVLEANIKEINTIENRKLEKYFDINKTFGLPSSYFEKYYKK